jgi:replicative DNA helicase
MNPELPHNIHVEQAAIGSMLFHTETINTARADIALRPEMFFKHSHMTLVSVIFDCHQSTGGEFDVTLIASRLRAAGIWDEVGGMPYLSECMEKATLRGIAPKHFREVKSLHFLRQTIRAAQSMIDGAHEATDGEAYLLSTPQRLFDMMPARSGNQKSVGESLEESLQAWRDIKDGKRDMAGLKTGVRFLDDVFGGLSPGYHAVGARISCGKTTLAGQIGQYFNETSIPSGWVNMDMSYGDLYERNLMRAAQTNLGKFRKGMAQESDFDIAERVKTTVQDWPQHFLHAERDIANICSWIRLMHMTHGIKVVVIDYLQKCKAPHLRGAGKTEQISYCSAALKELGQQLGLVLIVLAQVNRGNVLDNRPPTVADLKDCGDIEQDAQTITMLYPAQDFPYDEISPLEVDPEKQKAIWVDVQKQQQGKVGAKEFWLIGEHFKMVEAQPYWGYPSLMR